MRKHLAAREVLVQTRSRMISLWRSLLREEGIRVPTGGAPRSPERVRALELSKKLAAAVEPLLVMHEQLCEQINGIDVKVAQATQNDELVKRLTTVPSVGAVTALTSTATSPRGRPCLMPLSAALIATKNQLPSEAARGLRAVRRKPRSQTCWTEGVTVADKPNKRPPAHEDHELHS